MAASSSVVGGHECGLFIGSVPEELKCGECNKVAREPRMTICCGEQFCKLCIELVLRDKKPCPSCGEEEVTNYPNKRDHRKILAMEVRCSMRDRGCEWTGRLEQLDTHLDINSGSCQFVDVKCPNECGQPVEKHHLPTHLDKECPKRDFFCKYCNFTATYKEVINDHWPQCPFYPVPCPNGCEILAIERGDLDAHLQLCSLEEVTCDFSYAGCHVRLVREEMERHLAENFQRHVLLMSKAVQEEMEQKERKIEQLEERLEEKERQIQELREEKDQQIEELREDRERVIQELREENERQIQELREEKERQIQDQQRQIQELEKRTDEQLWQKNEEIRELSQSQRETEGKIDKERQLRDEKQKQLEKTIREEQQRQIEETQAMVAQVEEQLSRNIFPLPQFTLNGFQGLKSSEEFWDSRPVYTHPGGYRVGIRVRPSGSGAGRGTHVTVWPCTVIGENDEHLKWPADCTFTVQLLNQHRDQDHVTVSRRRSWEKPGTTQLWAFDVFSYTFIAHNDLGWNAKKQTQYLKNDCLKFRITDIQVHSI